MITVLRWRCLSVSNLRIKIEMLGMPFGKYDETPKPKKWRFRNQNACFACRKSKGKTKNQTNLSQFRCSSCDWHQIRANRVATCCFSMGCWSLSLPYLLTSPEENAISFGLLVAQVRLVLSSCFSFLNLSLFH